MLRSNITTNSFVVEGLTIGVTYKFYVRSRNAFGLSANSATFSILCAAAPLAPPAPTTKAVLDQIEVSWPVDSSNQGSSITSYQIFIRNRDQNYI